MAKREVKNKSLSSAKKKATKLEKAELIEKVECLIELHKLQGIVLNDLKRHI